MIGSWELVLMICVECSVTQRHASPTTQGGVWLGRGVAAVQCNFCNVRLDIKSPTVTLCLGYQSAQNFGLAVFAGFGGLR